MLKQFVLVLFFQNFFHLPIRKSISSQNLILITTVISVKTILTSFKLFLKKNQVMNQYE